MGLLSKRIAWYRSKNLLLKPLYNNQCIENKTVAILCEGGYGDQIIAIRYAEEIKRKNGSCIVICDSNIKPLFETVVGVSKVYTSLDFNNYSFDYWIPSLSVIPRIIKIKSGIPNDTYIFSRNNKTLEFERIINSKKLKIGIKWKKHFPAQYLLNLCKDTDYQFYNLTIDNDLINLPENIIDLKGYIKTWGDTAACIENLDLIISSCTSIAHLASAMGKKTWVVVPISPYYIWANHGQHTPWYKTSTIVFRQKTRGDWDEVFRKLEHELILLKR